MNNNEIEYFLEKNFIDYPLSISFMEKKVEDIHKNKCKEFLWFLEHEDIYTAGTSAKSEDLLEPDKFKVYKTNRGGKFTYHGPGQRIVYVMLDLRKKSYYEKPSKLRREKKNLAKLRNKYNLQKEQKNY